MMMPSPDELAFEITRRPHGGLQLRQAIVLALNGDSTAQVQLAESGTVIARALLLAPGVAVGDVVWMLGDRPDSGLILGGATTIQTDREAALVQRFTRLNAHRITAIGHAAQPISSGAETILTMVRAEINDESGTSSSTTSVGNDRFGWASSASSRIVVQRDLLTALVLEVEFTWATPNAAVDLLYTLRIKVNGILHTTQRLRLPKVDQTIVSYGGLSVAPLDYLEATVQQDSGSSVDVTGAQLIAETWG